MAPVGRAGEDFDFWASLATALMVGLGSTVVVPVGVNMVTTFPALEELDAVGVAAVVTGEDAVVGGRRGAKPD